MARRTGRRPAGSLRSALPLDNSRSETSLAPIVRNFSARRVQSVVDRLRKLAADAVHFCKVVDARPHDPLQTTELPQQFPTFARPEPGHRLQDRVRACLGTALPMTGDREAVSLVADALDQMQRRRVGGEQARMFFARKEQAFLPGPAVGTLGDTGDADTFDLQLLEDADCLGEL